MKEFKYFDRERKRKSVVENTMVNDFLNSWLAKVILIGLSVFLLYSVYRSILITSQKLDILKQAESEVDDLRLKNLSYSIQLRDMSSDDYLEEEARNRLNYTGENEIVFVIPENVLEESKEWVGEILSEENITIRGTNSMDVWINFIYEGY